MAEKKVIKIKQRRKKNRQYFFCYNVDLADYLKQEEFEPITKALAVSTQEAFWLFEITDELDEAIQDYKSKSKGKKKIA